MSKTKDSIKDAIRDMRGDALWDGVKGSAQWIWTYIIPSSLTIAYQVFKWFRGMPTHLLIEISIFLVLIGTVGAARAFQRYRKRPSELAENDLKPAITGTKEPTQKIPTNIDAQQIFLHTLELHFEIKKLEPNLDQLKVENLPAHNDENGVIVVGKASQAETFRAIVIPFHNNEEIRGRLEVKRKVGKIVDVSAQINYRYFNGSETLRIKRGAWLSEKESRVNFGVNDTRRLLVAIVEENDLPHVYAIRRDFDSTYKGNITMREELQGDLIALSVRLLAETESEPIKSFEFMLEIVREPLLEVKVQSAFIWKWGRLKDFTSEGIQLSLRLYAGQKTEQIIEEVKDWETRAATFLGRHLSEQQKTNFLRAHPSLEQGVRGDFRLELPPITKDRYQLPLASSHWTLNDSIQARTKILEECGNRL